MSKYLIPIAPNIFVTSLWLFGLDENLANRSLLAAISALILNAIGTIYFAQTVSELP